VLPKLANKPRATRLALARTFRVLRFVFMLSPMRLLK
jgi:hypothetical protein